MLANALQTFQLTFGPNSNPFKTWMPLHQGGTITGTRITGTRISGATISGGETIARISGHDILGMLAAGAGGETMAGVSAIGAMQATGIRTRRQNQTQETGGTMRETGARTRRQRLYQ